MKNVIHVWQDIIFLTINVYNAINCVRLVIIRLVKHVNIQIILWMNVLHANRIINQQSMVNVRLYVEMVGFISVNNVILIRNKDLKRIN